MKGRKTSLPANFNPVNKIFSHGTHVRRARAGISNHATNASTNHASHPLMGTMRKPANNASSNPANHVKVASFNPENRIRVNNTLEKTSNVKISRVNRVIFSTVTSNNANPALPVTARGLIGIIVNRVFSVRHRCRLRLNNPDYRRSLPHR
jgi:phage-related tail fiber protein